MAIALTIAGSDPSGGAGIQADLKTFAAHEVYGASAITAVTVQSTRGVESVTPLDADLVTAQIEAVAADLAIDATKLGMLANAAIVEAVAAAIKELELPLVVVDPVLVSSNGALLLDEDGIRLLCSELLRLARVVTPNIPEAERLSGRRITSIAGAREAAKRLHDMGAAAVIVTGGHARWESAEVVDVLYDGHGFHELRAPRVAGREVHGTGCTFASAVAAGLAHGIALPEAAARAQQYVARAIEHAPAIGHGKAPLNHFWPFGSAR
jgi:hydroxymethylpyrimidine/phosphomethylpyrimidine kinase